MNIGFDAKRAFHNGTGLGHYSRTLINSLSTYYPQHQYYLFNPKASTTFQISGENIHEVQPSGIINSLFTSYWRSSGVKKDLLEHNIDLYHGLSHEIPIDIAKTGVRSIVTMHDLIHERYPNQYKKIDAAIYTRKFKYSCEHADRIIAISRQTKQDIIDFYGLPGERISICYQSCNPGFSKNVTDIEKQTIRRIYGLPEKYFLHVGSIIERKNLLTICKAMVLLRNEFSIPLVVIGDGGNYKKQVKDYLVQNSLENQVIFLSDSPVAKQDPAFRTAKVFPVIYQQAIAMLYPSMFEGFGIPVMEALFSKLPVITSNVSSLPEAGGDGAYYVNPESAEEIAEGMRKIYLDPDFANELSRRGSIHAQNFTPEKTTAAVMKVYEEVIRKNS